MKFPAMLLKAILRISIGAAGIGGALAAAVLTLSTSIGKVAGRVDGEAALVVGVVTDQSGGEQIARVTSPWNNDEIFVIGKDDWPESALVAVYGVKRETDTGRAVLIESRSWRIPFDWVTVRNVAGWSILPMPMPSTRWAMALLGAMLVLAVVRFTLRLAALAVLTGIGLMAGISLARAAVEFHLVADSVACAAVVASVLMTTLVASRLAK